MSRPQEILEVARDMFLKSGTDGLSMRKLAARVKISAPAIYRHYASKDELLKKVVDLGRERFTSYLVRGLSASTPRERLILTGESYLEFAFSHPHDYRMMFMAWDKLKIGVHSPGAPGQAAPMFQFLLDRVRECLPDDISSDPQAVLGHALLFWAECHGLASLYLAGGGKQMMPLEAYRAQCRALIRQLVEKVLA